MRALETLTPEDLAAQLDADRPHWVTEWANQTTLRELAEGTCTMEQARKRVLANIAWPTARAVYCALARD